MSLMQEGFRVRAAAAADCSIGSYVLVDDRNALQSLVVVEKDLAPSAEWLLAPFRAGMARSLQRRN
jgi:hypothetical protein